MNGSAQRFQVRAKLTKNTFFKVTPDLVKTFFGNYFFAGRQGAPKGRLAPINRSLTSEIDQVTILAAQGKATTAICVELQEPFAHQ